MKKILFFVTPVLCAMTFLLSCDKKDGSSSSRNYADEPIVDLDELQTPVSPSGLDARANAMGFAAHLPKETECVIGLYRGEDLLDKLRGSALVEWIEERSKEEGVDLDQVEADPQAQMIASLFAEEALIAFGAGTGKQGGTLAKVSGESNYIMLRQGLGELARATSAQPTPVDKLMLDRLDRYLDVLEGAEMPPVTIALKAGAENAEALLPLVLGSFDQVRGFASDEVISDVELERLGSKLTGFEIKGTALSDMIRKELPDELPLTDEQKERALNWLASRNLVVVAGVIGDHLLLMAGPSASDLALVEELSDSVLARSAMSFIDPHLGNPVHAAIFASEQLQANIMAGNGGLERYASALKDGLAEIPALGDLRDVTALVDRIVKLDKELRGAVDYSDFGLVAFVEDGFKVEAYGGASFPTLDSSSPREFAPMAGGSDLFIFANWKGDNAMAKKQGELVDSLGELVWVMANKLAGLEVEVPDFDLDELRGVLSLLDEEFAEEFQQVIKALRGDLPDGFGAEGAVAVDMKGEVPGGIPQIPAVLVEKGRLPRVTFAQTVQDRTKIGAAWQGLEMALKSVLNKAEVGMTMPSFLTSEKDDLVSYFYPFPFLTDDFIPNVTVGDNAFYLSTSKTFVYELNSRVSSGQGADTRKGAVVDVNFGVLREYARQWLSLVDENIEDLAPNEASVADFRDNKELIEDFIQNIDSLESLNFHMREDRTGRSRISLHLKIK